MTGLTSESAVRMWTAPRWSIDGAQATARPAMNNSAAVERRTRLDHREAGTRVREERTLPSAHIMASEAALAYVVASATTARLSGSSCTNRTRISVDASRPAAENANTALKPIQSIM